MLARGQGVLDFAPHQLKGLLQASLALLFWVAVRELKLIYHNGCVYIYIYMANDRVSPV